MGLSRSKIVRKILNSVENGEARKPENIANSTGIRKDIADEYLSELAEEGILEKHESETTYKITKKGESFLKSYKKLDDLSSILIVF